MKKKVEASGFVLSGSCRHCSCTSGKEEHASQRMYLDSRCTWRMNSFSAHCGGIAPPPMTKVSACLPAEAEVRSISSHTFNRLSAHCFNVSRSCSGIWTCILVTICRRIVNIQFSMSRSTVCLNKCFSTRRGHDCAQGSRAIRLVRISWLV